jgi:protein SCO1/2
MTAPRRGGAAIAALGLILVVTASWWMLALWPAGRAAPDWWHRTREVCFGSTPDGLPSPGGWLLLVGQPIGMLFLLLAGWGRELRAGLANLTSKVTGQLTVGVVGALILVGAASVVSRVRDAAFEPFLTGEGDIASQLTRVNDAAPALALTAQTGATVTLEAFRGRTVLVTFAYAHCETVCPRVVSDVLAAQRRIGGGRAAVLIVTLDPWRDTPSRLASMAEQWGLSGDAHVLSGAPAEVERTLNAWRVPRARNMKTGGISHPSMVYVVGPTGRIAYVVGGNAETIAAAVRALSRQSA